MQVTNQKKAHLKYSKELNVRSLPHVPWLGIGIDRGSGPRNVPWWESPLELRRGGFKHWWFNVGQQNGGDKVTDVCVQHVIHVCLGVFDVAMCLVLGAGQCDDNMIENVC